MADSGFAPTGRHRSLLADLAALHLPAARPILVGCSMRRVGPVADGARGLLAAIREVVGPAATVVVPTQTANNSITSPAYRQATRGFTDPQIVAFEAAMEGFDAVRTPSFRMGAFAEFVRQHPGAVRSAHPQTSFSALGPAAGDLMAIHDLDCHLGERSPLAALHAADAHVLLMAVGYEAYVGLHLAEYRLAAPPPVRAYRCYVSRGAQRIREDFDAADLDDSDFARIGAEIDRQPFVRGGPVGSAFARAMPLREAVDFAIGWMNKHRGINAADPADVSGLPSNCAARLGDGEGVS